MLLMKSYQIFKKIIKKWRGRRKKAPLIKIKQNLAFMGGLLAELQRFSCIEVKIEVGIFSGSHNPLLHAWHILHLYFSFKPPSEKY